MGYLLEKHQRWRHVLSRRFSCHQRLLVFHATAWLYLDLPQLIGTWDRDVSLRDSCHIDPGMGCW